MCNRNLLTAVWIFASSLIPLLAQTNCNFSIEGKVFDRYTQEPIPFVKILISESEKGTLTDNSGSFKFENLCRKEYDLVFSYLGYKTTYHHHDFHHSAIELFMAPDTLLLSSVIVEASKNKSNLASMTQVRLGPEELALTQTQSLGDVLEQIAGVSSLRTGQNIVKPIIHGLHSNRILVMNNGIRHEFQNWGIEHAPEIDPSLVESIEVIKGAATVKFGPDALGGVILINPPKMELSTPFQGNISLTGKSNGRSGEGSVELKKGFKDISILGGGAYIRQGDLHAPNYQLSNTGKEESSYYGALRYHPLAELDIEAYYSHFEQELGILSGSVFGNLEDLQRAIEIDTPLLTQTFSYDIGLPKQVVTHDLYKLKAQYTGEKQSLAIQYGYQLNHRQEFGVRRVEAPNIDLELRTESLDADWLHPNWGKVEGKLGVQWQAQENDNLPGTNTVPFIPNYTSTRYGAYLIESINLGRARYEFGLRYDLFEASIVGREPDNTIYQNEIEYENWSGTIGMKYQISETETFQSNFGTAWRPPNVSELYRFGQHTFFLEYGLWRYTIDQEFDFVTTREGILDESDREVPSEVGYKWISTYAIQKPNFQAEFTGYINYVQNYIYSKPAGVTRTPRGVFAFFIYDQTDALFWGVDLSAKWKHNSLFSSTAKGSYLWVQQVNPKENFAQMPPAKVEYLAEYRPKIPGFTNSRITLDLSYTFEQFQHPRIIEVEEFLQANTLEIDRFRENAADFDILPPPQGFFLANAAFQGNTGKFSWQLQVRNMLNTRYRVYTDRMRYFADDLGRNVVLGVSYGW